MRALVIVGLSLAVCGGALSVIIPAAQARSQYSFLSRFSATGDTQKLTAFLKTESPDRVFLSTPSDATYDSKCINGVLALQLMSASIPFQSSLIALGDCAVQPVTNKLLIPMNETYPHYIPIYRETKDSRGTLFLVQSGSSFLQPSGRNFRPLATFGSVHVYRYRATDPWIFVQSIRSDGSMTKDELSLPANAFFVLSVECDAPVAKGMVIELEYRSVAQPLSWHVYSSTAFGFVFAGGKTSAALNSGPLKKGITEIFITPQLSPPGLHSPTPVTLTAIRYGDLLQKNVFPEWMQQIALKRQF